ncbi:MAG TPA: 16S rRNA pseudouridine(516) synthase [Porticoccaceae bacterium]|nr:16S rRNA pseudouridine(516) synthase [Porticoccaceae bacterium]
MVRLDKYISNATDISRSEVKRIIKTGAVEIDDQVATNPAIKVTLEQKVSLDGSVISAYKHRYFMLNKPAGVVSVSKDQHNPTALSLVYEHRSDELQIAGRLDIDTTGLLLITDDGNWNHRLTSPRSKCIKVYAVTLANPIEDNYPEQLSLGVQLDGEKHRCMPATMTQIDSHCLTLAIGEGKYHQVKRMFVALGNHVVKLHRFRVGDITLDEDLAEGDYRALSEAEVACIG